MRRTIVVAIVSFLIGMGGAYAVLNLNTSAVAAEVPPVTISPPARVPEERCFLVAIDRGRQDVALTELIEHYAKGWIITGSYSMSGTGNLRFVCARAPH